MSSKWDRNHGPPISSQMFYQLSYWGPRGELFCSSKWFFLLVADDFNKKSPNLIFPQIMSLDSGPRKLIRANPCIGGGSIQIPQSSGYIEWQLLFLFNVFNHVWLYIFLTLLIQSSILGGMRKPQTQIGKGEEKRFVWCGRWNSFGGN